MVLYGGRVMEQGSAESIFYTPSHPYTVGLLGAIPRMDKTGQPLVAIPGTPPNMSRPIQGCPFQPRCTLALPQCNSHPPTLAAFADNSNTLRACHQPLEQINILRAANFAKEVTHA